MSKIRQSARGKECQVRIVGVCNGRNDTVVWAHCNGLASGRGIGLKAKDLLGAYACSDCHDAYDRRTIPEHVDYEQIQQDFYAGHIRSLVILIDDGIIKI